jgi:hypothetical protein
MTLSTEPGTGSFPTMGTSASVLSRVGKPAVGRERPRGIGGKGGSDIPGHGDKANRGRIAEHAGASYHVGATLYAANAASASDTGRHVTQMKSVASVTDNWRGAARKAQGSSL